MWLLSIISSCHKLCLSCANAEAVVGQDRFSQTQTLLTNSTCSEAGLWKPGLWNLSWLLDLSVMSKHFRCEKSTNLNASPESLPGDYNRNPDSLSPAEPWLPEHVLVNSVIFRASLVLLTRARTRFGLTRPFFLKQDQSSSHRSAEPSSIGFITTRGTAPDQRVRTLLPCFQGFVNHSSLDGAVFLPLPPLGWGFVVGTATTNFCTEFTAVGEIQ